MITSSTSNTVSCPGCGTENSAGNKFCESCGAAMNQSQTSKAPKKKSKKKLIIAIVAGIVLLAAIVTGIIFYTNSQAEAKYNETVAKADQYLADQDYEKAETAYLEAIGIDPKKEPAYLKLADTYVVQDKGDEALSILETATQEIPDSKKIKAKYEEVKYAQFYYEYLNETVIPKVGLADLGKAGYSSNMKMGLVSALLLDINDDGIPEMLTVSSPNRYDMGMAVSLYAQKDGEVVETGNIPFEADAGMEDKGNEFSGENRQIYVKQSGDKFYLLEVGHGVYSGGSTGSEDLTVYEVTAEGGLEKVMEGTSSVSNGLLYMTLNGEEIIVERDFVEDSQYRSDCKKGYQKLQQSLEAFGLQDQVQLKDVKDSVYGSCWISFLNGDAEQENQWVLAQRQREWNADYQSRTEDFTDIRSKL